MLHKQSVVLTIINSIFWFPLHPPLPYNKLADVATEHIYFKYIRRRKTRRDTPGCFALVSLVRIFSEKAQRAYFLWITFK